MKSYPDIYTWVGTPHIVTSGESAYYSVSGGTPHIKSCLNVHIIAISKDRGLVGRLVGWFAVFLSDYSANTDSILQAET